jgi:hypothetical protein
MNHEIWRGNLAGKHIIRGKTIRRYFLRRKYVTCFCEWEYDMFLRMRIWHVFANENMTCFCEWEYDMFLRMRIWHVFANENMTCFCEWEFGLFLLCEWQFSICCKWQCHRTLCEYCQHRRSILTSYVGIAGNKKIIKYLKYNTRTGLARLRYQNLHA